MAATQFRVDLVKEQLVFSAAHFITFAGDLCESLHGHNYAIRAEVCGPLDENRYVIDFIAFRDTLVKISKMLDHHVLLPSLHKEIFVTTQGNEVTATFQNKRWVFPREDCVILPVVNTTAEEIAYWIATQSIEHLRPTLGTHLDWLEVAVDENNGQWGICRVDWNG